MEITKSIQYIFPTLEIGTDFMIIDNGVGPFIEWHNTEIPQPTQAELEVAWIEVQAETEIEVKVKRLNEINEKVLRLGGTNILQDIPEFEEKRVATIATLTVEAEEIKTFLIAQENTNFIGSVIDSIFS